MLKDASNEKNSSGSVFPSFNFECDQIRRQRDASVAAAALASRWRRTLMCHLSASVPPEHQTKPHPYPLTLLTLSPVQSPYTSYSCHLYPSTDPFILYRTPLQCSTSYTVESKPQALGPTPLVLKYIPHPCALKPNFKTPPPLPCKSKRWCFSVTTQLQTVLS